MSVSRISEAAFAEVRRHIADDWAGVREIAATVECYSARTVRKALEDLVELGEVEKKVVPCGNNVKALFRRRVPMRQRLAARLATSVRLLKVFGRTEQRAA